MRHTQQAIVVAFYPVRCQGDFWQSNGEKIGYGCRSALQDGINVMTTDNYEYLHNYP